MKDIELPPLPEPTALGMDFDKGWDGVRAYGYTEEDLQAYARAAIEADRAQRVPDWAHPKVQALIGSDARKRIQIDLMWRILENPNDEFGPSDMEYWDTIHDRLKSALLASTPAPAQGDQRVPDGWKQEAAEAIDWLLNNIRRDAPQLSGKAMGNAVRVRDALLASTPAPAQQEPGTPMDAHRAAYFMRRFLHEEKMLGPNEQAALQFTIAALEALESAAQHQEPPQQEKCPSCRTGSIYACTCPFPTARNQEQPQQERKPMTDEIVRLAGVALNEMPHPVTNWQSAAKKVCEAVAAIKDQT